MASPAPTIEGLERRIRKALLSENTRVIRYAHPNNAGEAVWTDGNDGVLLIKIDPFWNGELATLVHELSHYVLRLDRVWGQLEEPMILGLEVELSERIKRSHSRSRWWRRALNQKLGEG